MPATIMSKSKLVGTISCLPGVLSSNPGGEQQNINKKFVGHKHSIESCNASNIGFRQSSFKNI